MPKADKAQPCSEAIHYCGEVGDHRTIRGIKPQIVVINHARIRKVRTGRQTVVRPI